MSERATPAGAPPAPPAARTVTAPGPKAPSPRPGAATAGSPRGATAPAGRPSDGASVPGPLAPAGGGPRPPLAFRRAQAPAEQVPPAARRLLLIGTGHVFRLRAPVAELVALWKPRAIAVELDALRLRGLLERERAKAEGREPPKPKGVGPVYRLLARFQERLAAAEGSEVGEEMLAGADAARDLGLPLLTIDVDARGLFGRAWREMRWRERLRLLRSTLKGLFGGRTEVQAEIDVYNKDPAAYLGKVGDELPTVKRVFIDERDEHMAARLAEGLARFGAVAAVVGDGHVEGLKRRLAGRNVVPELVLRLPDLRDPARLGAAKAEAASRGAAASRLALSEDGTQATWSL